MYFENFILLLCFSLLLVLYLRAFFFFSRFDASPSLLLSFDAEACLSFSADGCYLQKGYTLWVSVLKPVPTDCATTFFSDMMPEYRQIFAGKPFCNNPILLWRTKFSLVVAQLGFWFFVKYAGKGLLKLGFPVTLCLNVKVNRGKANEGICNVVLFCLSTLPCFSVFENGDSKKNGNSRTCL